MSACWNIALFLIIQCAVLVSAGGTSAAQTTAAAAGPSPLSFPPAQNWDGPDGPWSSFLLRVGTPAQDVRVLISSASQATWVVIPDGCGKRDPTSCSDDRGGLFNYNQSSTWAQNGLYEIWNEQNLGLSGNGLWGNDTLGLAVQGSGGPTLQNQVVAGIVTDNFYLGMFGVNPKPTNYTTFTSDPQDSYMTALKKQKLIPSISFGYTAGAAYRLKKVLGSLTLGGYDSSRFIPNPLSVSFATDNDRDTIIGIQSIKSTNQNGTTNSLLTRGILAYVDTTIPYIWLPLEACKAFEKAFGLTWDKSSELYLVDDALHTDLLAQNATVDFTLGNGISGGQTVDITLPYASFDLIAKYPLVNNTSNYFPLKRASNETQYTLGRTFLQEAYFTVDYERSNFSISQCLFQEGSQERLIGIQSVNATATPSGPAEAKPSNQSTIIGIAVAAVVLIAAVVSAVVLVLCIRKRNRKRKEEGGKAATAEETEEAAERIRKGFDKAELGAEAERYEMAGSGPQQAWVKEKADLAEYPGTHELTGGDVEIAELADRKRPVYEMYDPSAAPVELPAEMPQELLASIPAPRSPRSTTSFHSARRSPHVRSDPSSPISSPSSRPSPIDRRLGCTPQSRSSTLHSTPSVPSPTSQSGPSAPRSPDMFSPISPVGDNGSGGRRATDQIPLATMLRNFSQAAPSLSGTPRGAQRSQQSLLISSPGGNSNGSQRSQQSPLISSLRNDESRRRRRNEF